LGEPVPATRENLERAAALLREGKLVAFPTETVYGLGANALDPTAVRRIYEAKGRPSTSPLIVHVASIDAARELVTEWPQSAQHLAERFWPGPLTLVLPKRAIVPDIVTAGLPSVGIRIPANPVARELLELARIPIAAPSANRFTQLSPTTAAHVQESLGDRVDLILDGGACEVGIESTVVALTGSEARLLRPGMVSRTELEEVIGTKLSATAEPRQEKAHESPGMHVRHYQPKTRLLLSASPPSEGRGAVLHLQSGYQAAYKIAMPVDPHEYAAKLYQMLHELDALHLDWIWVEMPPDEPQWEGVRDRLRRAAAL
jgi:L-threonylcarbamoyladenylate synthase